jgi:hypothetical protein
MTIRDRIKDFRRVPASTLRPAPDSGWCYRTLFFQDRAAERRAKVSNSMGYPLPISKTDPSVAALVGNSRLVAVAGVWSKDDAVVFATRMIETLGE